MLYFPIINEFLNPRHIKTLGLPSAGFSLHSKHRALSEDYNMDPNLPNNPNPGNYACSVDDAIRHWWKVVAENPNDMHASYSLYINNRRKYSPDIHPSIIFDLYFVFLYYVLRPSTRKLMEWGSDKVDWSPFASEDDLMMLEPYMERTACNDHTVSLGN